MCIAQEAVKYWELRINELRSAGKDQTSEIENDERAQALMATLNAGFDGLLRTLGEVAKYDKDGDIKSISDRVLNAQGIAVSMHAVADDFLMAMQTQPGGSGQTHSPSNFTKILNGVLSLFKSLSNWLLSLLQTATKLKSWKISGDVGSNVLGLASAKLEVTFGS